MAQGLLVRKAWGWGKANLDWLTQIGKGDKPVQRLDSGAGIAGRLWAGTGIQFGLIDNQPVESLIFVSGHFVEQRIVDGIDCLIDNLPFFFGEDYHGQWKQLSFFTYQVLAQGPNLVNAGGQ